MSSKYTYFPKSVEKDIVLKSAYNSKYDTKLKRRAELKFRNLISYLIRLSTMKYQWRHIEKCELMTIISDVIITHYPVGSLLKR